MERIRPIIWENNTLKLLDQRILPHKESYLPYTQLPAVADAISDMVVRGAPAIGITAAYAMVLAVKQYYKSHPNDWKQQIKQEVAYLAKARPTAINLHWAISEMQGIIDSLDEQGEPLPALLQHAIKIHEEDIANNKLMGELGANLIKADLSSDEKCSVITHCNAGALATGGYGTALGVIRSAWNNGCIAHVYADETRPWMQGARLTAWEMVVEDIPVSLLVEGAASFMMQNLTSSKHPIKWVIVGSDRIAANGDVANKIGTFGLAVLAKYHGIKVMVVAPTSTIDFNVSCGEEIPIEERSLAEVLTFSGQQTAAKGASARNPAFDVTPATLIDAIVTEKGIVLQPNREKMAQLK